MPLTHKVIFLCFVIAFSLTPCSAHTNSVPFPFNIELSSESEKVFFWEKDACDEGDNPDAGIRAFRNSENLIYLFASGNVARPFVGKSFSTLVHQCRPVFKGNEDDAPSAFSDRSWLAAFYTEDGKKIHTLIHNEYQGHRRPSICQSDNYFQCWRNSITYALSENSGQSFSYPTDGHLVATIPYAYDGEAKVQTGYFNPTNIIKYNGYYYTLFAAQPYKAQKSGLCIMRTATLDVPSSWRAWNGKDFKVKFSNPYTTNPKPEDHVCEPIANGKIKNNQSSLVLHKESGWFLLSFSNHALTNNKIVPGFYVAASRNLIEWTEKKLILSTPISLHEFKEKKNCRNDSFYAYPSLIDENSTSNNFETIDDDAYLYYAQIHLDKKCNPTRRRDLLRRRISLYTQK